MKATSRCYYASQSSGRSWFERFTAKIAPSDFSCRAAFAALCLALIFLGPAAAQAQAQSAPPEIPIPVATVPMRIIAGKFVVQAMLDGHGPFAIAIDSGAETLLVTPHVARLCRFPLRRGTVEVTGTQNGAALGVAQAQVAEIKIGAASVKNPFCTVSPTPLSVDGYIGAPLLNAFVTEIDPHAGTVSLYRPSSFAAVSGFESGADEAASAAALQKAKILADRAAIAQVGSDVQVLQSDGTPIPPDPSNLPGGAPPASDAPPVPPSPNPAPPAPQREPIGRYGVQIAVTLGFHRVPVAQGTLGGVTARLEIDTGSAFPAELTAPFVYSNHLASRFDRIGTVRLISSGVVGRAGVYSFDDLTLGKIPGEPNRPVSEQSSAPENGGGPSGARLTGTIPTLFLAPSEPESARASQYDGRIGAPLLAQFAITFDYARSRIFLRPSPPIAVAMPRGAQY